jgi:hypothetical protein
MTDGPFFLVWQSVDKGCVPSQAVNVNVNSMLVEGVPQHQGVHSLLVEVVVLVVEIT